MLECRELRDPPPHFNYVVMDLRHNIQMHNIQKSIQEWILINLKHRFYIGETLIIDNNQFVIKLKIGFEEPKEASFFLIACPHLKYSSV